jgi:hypothetical protein
MTQEPVSEASFLVFLKPTPLSYGQEGTEVILRELEARIKRIQATPHGSDKKSRVLKPIDRVLYGLQLIGMPGHGLLKMVQLVSTSVYKSYLYADISDHARVYVEVVGNQEGESEKPPAEDQNPLPAEDKVFIFMVCDRNAQNLQDMLRLI